jgi:hypothetical protein
MSDIFTFDQFVAGFNARYYSLTQSEIGDWRYGQLLFNILCTYRPDISEKLRATPLDPFFRDAKDVHPDTWAVINELW